jgi:(2S)-methylsuccinyl-CoA dehydrogenase
MSSRRGWVPIASGDDTPTTLRAMASRAAPGVGVDIDGVEAAIAHGQRVVGAAIKHIRSRADDADMQVIEYDLAHAAAAMQAATYMAGYGRRGADEARLCAGFAADALHDLTTKIFGREQLWGVEFGALDAVHEFVATYRDPRFVAGLANIEGDRGLDDDFQLVAETFRRFAVVTDINTRIQLSKCKTMHFIS